MFPRSVLSVPGSSPRMLEKAWASAADEVVIDLEDAVAPGEKDPARAAVAAFLSEVAGEQRIVAVRVNAPGTPWFRQDLIALASLPVLPQSIVLPKVEGSGDIVLATSLLEGADTTRFGGVQALIESAAGLTRLEEICSGQDGIGGLILGYADLAASLGRGRSPEPAIWLPAQERVLWSARTHGLRATDGPHLGVRPDEEFQAAVRRAVELGFDGKWVIHPSQIELVNEIFTPDDHEVTWARAVMDALETAEANGAGAVELEGRMLDEAVAVSARRVLSRAALTEVTR